MFTEKVQEFDWDHYTTRVNRTIDIPVFKERGKWQLLAEEVKIAHVEAGEKYLHLNWPPLTSTLFIEFERTGGRDGFETVYFERRKALCSLAVAECIEGEGRFLDKIIEGLWLICEESSWWIHAHNYLSLEGPDQPLPNVEEPLIDLFAAETGMDLAWVHYLFKDEFDKISPLISQRILLEVKKRIMEPFMQRDDFWWMGIMDRGIQISNWTTWCSENILMIYLLLEKDHKILIRVIERLAQMVDKFIDIYPSDGACTEGPSYWGRAGGALCDFSELLFQLTEGKLDFFKEPLVQEIGKFIYRANITGNYFVNYSDSPFVVIPESYAVYRFGKRIGDAKMMAFGAAVLEKNGFNMEKRLYSLDAMLRTIFDYDEIKSTKAEVPYLRDVWLEDSQFMIAREQEGTDKGLFLAAKGGHNDETHHNHNDVGTFIVYFNGKPMFIDVGRQAYTKKLFHSNERYSIWNTSSAYHSVPLVNGFQQKEGRKYKAADVRYQSDNDLVQFELDIAGAYPVEAGIQTWFRTFVMDRSFSPSIEITDRFSLRQPSKDVILTFIVSSEPQYLEEGKLSIDNVLSFRYNPNLFKATIQKVEQNIGTWGLSACYRMLFALRSESESLSFSFKIEQLK